LIPPVTCDIYRMGQCFTSTHQGDDRFSRMESRINELENALSKVHSENEQERLIAQLQLQCGAASSEIKNLKDTIIELQNSRKVLEESKSVLTQSNHHHPFIALGYESTRALKPSIAIVHCNANTHFFIMKPDGTETQMSAKRSPFLGMNSMACFMNTGESIRLKRPEFASIQIEGFLCPLSN
jgi:hypothetical protein